MAASYAAFSQLSLNGVRYDFHPSSMIGQRGEYRDTNGLRGNLQRSIERNLDTIYRVNGQIKTYPTPTELTTLWPILHGAAASGTTYPLSSTGLTGYEYVADRVAKVHTYAGVKVDRYNAGSSQGEAFAVDFDVVGTTESEGAAGTFASLSIDIATKPWMHHMLATTVAGTTFTPQSFGWELNWNIDKDRFFNSQTLSTGTNATDMVVTVRAVYPYGDSAAIYTTHSASTGVQVVGTWTNGVYITTATFVKVAFTKMAPEINSRGELMLVCEGQAMRSSSTAPLVLTMAVS